MARRLSSTIAVGDGSGGLFLGNSGPDLDVALRECPPLWPGPDDSTAPIHGIFLTDAELDHTLGLLSLRQARELHVYGTAAVRILLSQCAVLPTLESYTVVHWHEARPGERFALHYRDGTPSPVWCEPFDATSGRLSRYARAHYPPGSAPSSGVVVGYRIGDARTNRVAVFLPSVAALDQRLLQYLRRAQLILVDDTFWTDDELHRRQRGSATARSMGHQPVDGVDGSLQLLRRRTDTHIVYTHLNNTNPILFEEGAPRCRRRNSCT
ncbi:MAG TPA: MBL fold metallo-hydrolase [Pseudonocardiaceae bacterium]